jgi:beta-phosphoglucomutase-like phosphatase (HAD superfamily)
MIKERSTPKSKTQNPKSKRIRAFLFDMDGLLLDTEAVHIRAYAELTRELGKPQTYETLTRFIGHSHPVACRWLIDEAGVVGEVDAMIAREQEIYFHMLHAERPHPLPGVKEMFDISDQLKMLRALVSSSVDYQVDPTMQIVSDHLGRGKPWKKNFQSICTGDRVEQRKPAPDLYLLAVRELGVKPDECVAFEDSPAGIEAACAAGLRVVAVPNFHLKEVDVVQGRTNYVFTTLLEVAANIEHILK